MKDNEKDKQFDANDDCKAAALPSHTLKSENNPLASVCSPYVPPTQEDIDRYKHPGLHCSDHVQYTERNPIGLGLSMESMELDHHNSIGLEC